MMARTRVFALLTSAILTACSGQGASAPLDDTDNATGDGDQGDGDPGDGDQGDGDQGDGDQHQPPTADAGATPSDAGAADSDAQTDGPAPDAQVPDEPDPLAGLPDRARIVEAMRRVNDHFIASHPDPGNNLWARGVYFVGNMATHRVTGDDKYLDYAEGWAEKHAWGLSGGASTRFADNQVAGQTYLALHALAPSDGKIAMIEASLSAMADSPKVDDWWWCDALFMAMPAFTRLGVLRNEPRYFEAMGALYDHARDGEGGPGLYDREDHLWFRDKGFLPPRPAPNGRDIFWSRGNGWVFAALARTLEDLPASDAHHGEYQQTFVDMAAALLAVQRSDGFWNASLHDPSHFGGPESSGTSLFSFGFAWGIRQGLLPADAYGEPLARAYHAILDTAVHPDGFLGFVQDVGYEPGSSQPVHYNTTSDFGVGVFLLASSEIHRIARD